MFSGNETEKDEVEIGRYMVMLGRMETACKLVTQAREFALQIKLNGSLVGVGVSRSVPSGFYIPGAGVAGSGLFGAAPGVVSCHIFWELSARISGCRSSLGVSI